MRRLLLSVLCMLAASVLTTVQSARADEPAVRGLLFGVSPGLMFQGAYVGWDAAERLTIVGGLDFARVSGSFADSGSSKGSETISLGVYVPRLGARYDLTRRNVGRVNAFGTGSLFTAFPTFDSSADAKAVAEFKKTMAASSLYGLTLGLGAEYTVAGGFSISAEYGLRFLFASTLSSQTHTSTDFDPVTGKETTTTTTDTLDLSAGLQHTYTTVSLNFRF